MKAICTIGFTGTIASGKSSRCKRLVEVAKEHQRVLDAAASAAATVFNKPNLNTNRRTSQSHDSVLVHYINADRIGHSVYEPGKPCYKDLVHHFGSSILSHSPVPTAASTSTDSATGPESGDCVRSPKEKQVASRSFPPPIDRRVLGEVVFADEHNLRDLNAICWPYITSAIRAEYAAVCARAKASALPSGIEPGIVPSFLTVTAPADVALIIIEAALLCEMTEVLGLTTDLWVTHCTPETAVDRLMQRNALSREAAVRRVASQREVGERLQALREVSYKGDIEVFDTTQVSLAEGLKETERAFEKYWTKKVLVHLSENSNA